MLGQYTYDFEVQTMVVMFMNAMSDIIIKRFNNNKASQDQIKARLVYAPKQRVLADLLDKDQNLQLPVVAVYIGGISRDINRVYNKILGTYSSSIGGSVRNDATPLPIDLTLNVTIATRYQADMDQIISHILPYINPYFIVSWRTPGRPDYEIRSSVFWDGNVSFSYPFDITATQVAKVIADLTFTFKGWMFQSLNMNDIASIYTINTTYNASSPGIPAEYLLTSGATIGLTANTDNSDFVQIKGVPPQPKIIDPYYAEIGEFKQFNVFGAGLKAVNNVYLSGAPLNSLMTSYDPFSAIPTLSAVNPPFTAVKLLSSYWAYNKDNYLTFVMPSAASTGRVDLVVEGPAGYGLLTKSVRVNTSNPFVSSSPEFASFVPYQMPYLSGIEIRPYTNG
tara:strand:- start:102 stop:1283 length:1182 start_codon:yes stop_codon:yes gene_type:complete